MNWYTGHRGRVEPSGADLIDMTVQLAHYLGWKVHHCRPARTDKGYRTPIQGDAGFPDLMLAKPPRVIFAEVKAGKDTMSLEQLDWKQCLEHCPGVEYYRWGDWDSIEKAIRGEG